MIYIIVEITVEITVEIMRLNAVSVEIQWAGQLTSSTSSLSTPCLQVIPYLCLSLCISLYLYLPVCLSLSLQLNVCRQPGHVRAE